MSAEQEDQSSAPEGARRWLTWCCVTVFVGSFACLLGLSATAYWSPENSWIVLLDTAWRISLVIGAIVWAIPRAARGLRRLGAAFSGGPA